MKALNTGDLHLTNRCPINRIDNYEEEVLRKFHWILTTAYSNNCKTILQPGDFSDAPNLSYDFFIKICSLINHSNITIVTVPGQHDFRYRNANNTFLRALEEACPSLIVLWKPQYIEIEGVHIYGSGWGEQIPEIQDLTKYNILITHRMVVDEKLWDNQENFNYANVLLRSNKFDLIVSGDNHKSFIVKMNSKFLVNLGSMMRNTISQIEHKPKIVILDTDSKHITEMEIPIKPAEEVFQMQRIEIEKERNERLEAFVSGLSKHKEMDLSFNDNLSNYLCQNSIEKEVVSIIQECLKES